MDGRVRSSHYSQCYQSSRHQKKTSNRWDFVDQGTEVCHVVGVLLWLEDVQRLNLGDEAEYGMAATSL